MTLSIKDTLKNATKQLKKQLPATQSAALEAQFLLQKLLNVDRAWLILHEADILQLQHYEALQTMLQRRLNGEPIAYILGAREFYGLNLKVTSDTLIPRADTEILVEAALAKISPNKTTKNDALAILDLGTGSGAIALAIAKNRPHVQVIALDASKTALKVAQENAQNLNIQNVTFLQSDWFGALGHNQTRFDLIVSNPPYIPQNDVHLTQGDLRFEPISALAAGADGLSDIQHIIKNCLVYLKPQGCLMLEHGYDQARSVADLMAHAGLVDIVTIQDFGGNDRVTIAKNPLIINQHWG